LMQNWINTKNCFVFWTDIRRQQQFKMYYVWKQNTILGKSSPEMYIQFFYEKGCVHISL
jgi:hypothetical protein